MTRKEAYICCILNIITLGLFSLLLAGIFDLYDQDAWYNKWPYWFFSTLCLIFPVVVTFVVFYIQILTVVAKHFNVDGSDIYGTPYSWILCLIVPFVGWVCFVVMLIYLLVFIDVNLIKNSEVQNG